MIKKSMFTVGLAVLTALTAIAADVQIAWDASLDALGYKVYVSRSTNTFTVYGSTSQTNTTMTLTNMVPDVYKIYVTATNVWGIESDPSNVIQTPTGTKPVPPVLRWYRIVNGAASQTAPLQGKVQ